MKYIKIFEVFNKTETVKLYHGSKDYFDMFDDEKISTGDSSELFGKGYYLTDNMEVAKFYSKHVLKKDKIVKYTNTGIFGTPEPVFSNDAEEYANSNIKINTFIFKGNVLNSDEYIISEDFLNYIRESYIKNSPYGEAGIKIFNETINTLRNFKNKIHNYRGELLYVIQHIAYVDKKIKDDILNYIRKEYDAIKYRPDLDFEENIQSWNYVVFNKNTLSNIIK